MGSFKRLNELFANSYLVEICLDFTLYLQIAGLEDNGRPTPLISDGCGLVKIHPSNLNRKIQRLLKFAVLGFSNHVFLRYASCLIYLESFSIK